MAFEKRKPWRSKAYLKWVASQPSVISGLPADDAHHIKRPGFSGTVKCSDLFAIPLTRDEHNHFHHVGWETWERGCNTDQRELVLKTLERAVREGVLDLK